MTLRYSKERVRISQLFRKKNWRNFNDQREIWALGYLLNYQADLASATGSKVIQLKPSPFVNPQSLLQKSATLYWYGFQKKEKAIVGDLIASLRQNAALNKMKPFSLYFFWLIDNMIIHNQQYYQQKQGKNKPIGTSTLILYKFSSIRQYSPLLSQLYPLSLVHSSIASAQFQTHPPLSFNSYNPTFIIHARVILNFLQHEFGQYNCNRLKTIQNRDFMNRIFPPPHTVICSFKIIEYKKKMIDFDIEKEELVGIVSANQTRTLAEEIDLLLQRGNDLLWLFRALASDSRAGISTSSDSLQKRRNKYGTNAKYQPPLTSFCSLFKEALDDFILKILMVSSVVSIGIEVGTSDGSERSTAWIEGFVILVAVAVCGLVTAGNNYSKERQFKQLNSVADERKRVTLRRNGELMEVHQDDILVGDVVFVNEGMEVPADAILFEANEITTDESAMTGETDPVVKNTIDFYLSKKQEFQLLKFQKQFDKHEIPSPILLSGTKVLTGQGKMMILVVGDASCIGKIRALLNQQDEIQTPLQSKLQKVASDIGKFGLYSAILILLILLVRFAIEKGMSKEWNTSVDLKELISYFILSITVIVVAIPEGLPLSVTLSLAVSVKQMLTDNNLVRKMEACETMGGANNICSDKTGTLTMNKMTLTEIWNGSAISIDNHKQKLSFEDFTKNNEWLQLLKIGTCVNSTANLRPEQKGSSTEIALLKFMQKSGVNYADYREKYPTFLKYPFSSSRKRMSIIASLGSEQYIFVKGASEMVLTCCNKWYDMQNSRIDMISDSIRLKMQENIKKMAESSLRTLCLAYKKVCSGQDVSSKDEKGVFNIEKNGLILLCILGVRDIPRKEVPGAIAKCHRAGIKVRMVTGDNIITARAIARDVGIIKADDDSLVMEGTEFAQLIGGVVCKKCRTQTCDCARNAKQADETGKEIRVDTIKNSESFDSIKDRLLVLARSRPEDKYALVTGLKERGEVVAVTGDGTNDAPALKKADVGFAMGISGTEVARQAAAIILLDDNFNSIVKAVMWGRNIYDSIRKFIQFQITVNIVAVTITLVGSAFLKQQILAPIQMLWINLIMDTLASLALATEAPTQELLERMPNSRHEHIVSNTMMKHIIWQAIFQFIVMIVLIFAGEHIIPEYADSLDHSVFATNPDWKWHNGKIGGTVRSGRMITIGGSQDYEIIYVATGIYSRHFTFIFNCFVMLQLFNFVSCRKIHEEINIFTGILSNKLFIVIVFSILGLQILLVTFGGEGLHVYEHYGLTIQQWLFCIGVGSIGIPINFLIKQFPVSQEPSTKDDLLQREQGLDMKNVGEAYTQTKMIKVQRVSSLSHGECALNSASANNSAAFNLP